MTATLAQTPLHDWHAAHGGRMVDFAGWSMPVQYASIVAEHNATRQAVGLFDVSHMGRLRFSGPGAAAFLDALVTRRVADMSPGQIRYALVTNDSGGILDDVLVYRLPAADRAPRCRGAVSPAGRQRQQSAEDCELDRSQVARPMRTSRSVDVTDDPAMIAVQGPRAVEVLWPPDRAPIFAATSTITAGEPQIAGVPRDRQPHRLHGRRRLRADRPVGRCDIALGASAARPAGRMALWPADWAAATRCGSKPACRSTATS